MINFFVFVGNEVNKIDSLVGGVFSVMDIRVVHSYKRPNTINRCNNALCSHLCLPTSLNSYRCACPPSMVLKNNMTCESSKSPKLIPITSTPTSNPSLVPSTQSSEVRTESLEEIELKKSHNRNKTHKHSNSNSSKNSDYSITDESDGKLAIIITVTLLFISLIIGTLTLFVYRKYQRYQIFYIIYFSEEFKF